MFSNLEIIASLNRTLVEEFEASERESGVLLVGQIFLKLADYLKMYTTYCANQPVSIATLESCSSQPAFSKFLSVCIHSLNLSLSLSLSQRVVITLLTHCFPLLLSIMLIQECMGNEKCRGLTLFSFLIKPIQVCFSPPSVSIPMDSFSLILDHHR